MRQASSRDLVEAIINLFWYLFKVDARRATGAVTPINVAVADNTLASPFDVTELLIAKGGQVGAPVSTRLTI